MGANQLELRQNEVEEKIKQLTAEVYAINISMDDHLIRDKEAAEEGGNIGRKMERAKNLILLYRKRVHKARKTTAKLMEEVITICSANLYSCQQYLSSFFFFSIAGRFRNWSNSRNFG